MSKEKDIFVVVEQRNGKVQNIGLELLGEATRLNEDLKEQVVAVLLGGEGISSEADRCIAYGADKVIVVDDPELKEYRTEPYAHALASVINEYKPEIMLVGATKSEAKRS